MYGSIIVFHLPPKINNTAISKFCQKLYGQDTSSWGGRYRYHRHGILDDIPHRKLIRGVIIVKSKDTKAIVDFLGQYSAEVHVRKIKLDADDCYILGLPFG